MQCVRCISGRKAFHYENDFKNVKSRGPSKFETDSSMWLIPYVKEYVCKRQDLLSGKSHSFMFMTVTGLPFSSSSFTSYLSGLFEKEVSIRAGTTKLRHALVTLYYNLSIFQNHCIIIAFLIILIHI